jgi:5'-3' exonuclease
MLSKNYVIIDGLNVFLRHFMVNETVNAGGELVGGTVGFIKALGGIISLLKPERVFVVWEQGGASPRRKHIYSEYKANRATNKGLQEIYRNDGKIIPSSNIKNKIYQLQLITKALGHLPVCQLYVPDTEADDVIAYLVKRKFQSLNCSKIVVSNDKDFYQLLEDSNVRIYDPAKKILIDQKYVTENFGISPRNITLARSVIGDNSDNLDGVPGIGFKTISQRFPDFIRDDVDLNKDWLVEAAKTAINGSKKPLKCFTDIIGHTNIIDRNWRLMYLDTNCLASTQISKIDFKVENFQPTANKLSYIKTFTGADIPLTQDLDATFSMAKTLIRES